MASVAAQASWRRWLRPMALLTLSAGLVLMLAGGSDAQDEGAVRVIAIDGEIDLGIAPFLDRALREAEEAQAAAVLLEIDTPGGRLDAVLQMRDALLGAAVPTIAYVDPTAFSAGALVALAADEIHFAPVGVMGAATPVVGGAGGTADAKVVSAVRSTFRATAEQRGRDPLVGEAMVDADIEIDGLVAEGSLLTLTAAEAERVGYSEGTAADRDVLLDGLGLGDRPVMRVQPSLAERLVRIITHPVLASVLVMIGMLLIVGELLAGAFGLAGLVGLGLLGTFFYGHLLAGLAGWEDVALVALGIVLILVELFVVPGFGVPGVLGLAAVLGGVYLAMLGRNLDFVTSEQLITTATTVGLTFIGITIGLIVLLTMLGRRRDGRDPDRRATARPAAGGTGRRRGWLRWFGDGDVLAREGESDHPDRDAPGRASVEPADGSIGVALTDLRPSGVADFDGRRVDVVTEGDYLRAGDRVEILHAERYRRVVRRAGG